MKNFRNYVYGICFEIISDHKALNSILKGNRANGTFSSRLIRWIDRLLPFQFQVSHESGRTLGMADNLSRQPSPINNNDKVNAEGLWNNFFTVNETNVIRPVSVEQHSTTINQSQASWQNQARSGKASCESELNKSCGHIRRRTIASNSTSGNSSKMEGSDSEKYATSTVEFTSRPPLKAPMCSSINQVEVFNTGQ